MILNPALVVTDRNDRGLETLRLSDAGGLRQFGVYVETLPPGQWTSNRHWHSAEDEFLYVLSGQATVVDDDGDHVLNAGDAACWRHGDPNAHHVWNRGTAPLVFLIAGSRVEGDICHYPDSGRRLENTATTWRVVEADGTLVRGGDLPPELLNLSPCWGADYDPAQPAQRIVRAGSLPPLSGNNYPAGLQIPAHFDDYAISDAGGLTQFGAFTETLHPGGQSAHRHLHEAEDEFLYVLSGTVTVLENDGAHDLTAGGAAAWPAGVANGHCLQNRSDTPATYLVIGTRAKDDICHFPEIDLHYTRKNGQRAMMRKDGTFYPGWPKGV